MPNETIYRRGSIAGALLLVGLGALFLYANLVESNPWPVVSQWWPLLLILLGLGKLWDHFRQRRHPEAKGDAGLTGGIIAVLVVLLLFGIALRGGIGAGREYHATESVERQGAESVRVQIEMGAGELNVAGGAQKLLEAEFHYNGAARKPKVTYEVEGSRGHLRVAQSGGGVHFGRTRNDWHLHVANNVPMELAIETGAGRSDLRLRGLSLTKLDVQMGAGELTADLTGDWKKDLDAKIQGGVGSATIRLPKNVGVRVHATGGIGSVNAHGLLREGDAYVNEAYGKSPVTLRLNVEGGIGEINLMPES